MKTFICMFVFFSSLMDDSGTIQPDEIEFTCLKTHKASNTCHFNFKIDGEKYRYVDIGCKKSKKRDEVIQKAKEGKLALAKDWKVECQESKD